KIIKTSLQVQIDNKIKVKAIIIGEGFERLRLEKILSQENLTDDIFLIGALPNASRLLKAFDIYICSSVKEGLPYSILEAGLAELPIIATNVGGIPDIINNHINGLLVESQNPTLLTQAIKELIANPQLRRELSAKVSVTINQNFKIERAIALTQENY
ncbi:MAG: glycosyltransferase family 4 protein, partial [Candidatus Falkowbacteria bacterium]|nr:glycosyltransferase family 4 protein [Candidatus Falkowbacteria bacterium]